MSMLCRVSQAKREQPSAVSNAPPCYLYKLRGANDFPSPNNAISGTNTTTFSSTPSLPLHSTHQLCDTCPPLSFLLTSPTHSANMADMDTYDNEPRTSGYDGMPYTYSPYANRRICSYEDLDESNTPSSDPWFRASEGDFNIYPHSRQSWHATPLRPSIY
jgi:hypothetical protein